MSGSNMHNFLSRVNIDIQAQEAQRFPKKMNPKKPTSRHIIIKMPKIKYKERILKAAKEKQLVNYKRVPIRLSADFSTETFQGIKDWHEIFTVMKSKDPQPRLLYPARLPFKTEVAKRFTDKNQNQQ